MMIRHDEEVLYFSSSTLVMLARSGTYYVVFSFFETKSLASVHFSAPLSKGLQERQRKGTGCGRVLLHVCLLFPFQPMQRQHGRCFWNTALTAYHGNELVTPPIHDVHL